METFHGLENLPGDVHVILPIHLKPNEKEQLLKLDKKLIFKM